MLLRVTNRNNFTLNDRYDGVDYQFKTNTPVVIEEFAARHIFGYGVPEKMPFLTRQGWCASVDKREEAMRKLNNFVFEEGKVEFVGGETQDIADSESTGQVSVAELANKVNSNNQRGSKTARLHPI